VRLDVACAAKAKASSAGKGFGAPNKQVQPTAEPEQPCPCGSGATYGVSRNLPRFLAMSMYATRFRALSQQPLTVSAQACCCPYHLKEAAVQTPEQLLRSRYTAYALKWVQKIPVVSPSMCQPQITHPSS
jgi:hypothetical protein